MLFLWEKIQQAWLILEMPERLYVLFIYKKEQIEFNFLHKIIHLETNSTYIYLVNENETTATQLIG